jgi:hypothetical protein
MSSVSGKNWLDNKLKGVDLGADGYLINEKCPLKTCPSLKFIINQ